MLQDRVRELAKCRGFDFGIEDHGCPVLWGSFEYEGGSEQSFGYMPDTAFLMRFIFAVGAQDKLSDVNGRSCWVTHDASRIYKVEPLHKKDGTPFDIEEWLAWKERHPDPSAANR